MNGSTQLFSDPQPQPQLHHANPLGVELELRTEGALLPAEAVTRIEDGFRITLPVPLCNRCKPGATALVDSQEEHRPTKFTLRLVNACEETSFSKLIPPKPSPRQREHLPQFSIGTQTTPSMSPNTTLQAQQLANWNLQGLTSP